MDETPKSRVLAVEIDMLIGRQAWEGGVRQFLLDRIETGREDEIWKLDDEFDKLNASPLGDKISGGDHVLGNLKVTSDCASDVVPTSSARAIKWRGIGLVMRLLFAWPVDGSPETTRHQGSLERLAWDIAGNLQRACSATVTTLCCFVYEQDRSLADVHNDQDIQAWTNRHALRRLGDRYVCYEPSTSLLRYIAGSTPRYHWCFVDPPPLGAIRPPPEVAATIQLEAARALLHQIKIEVEQYATIARTLVIDPGSYTPSTDLLHLAASLWPGYQEKLPSLATLAVEANDMAMRLTRSLRSLEDIFLIFHEDTLWDSGDLTLQHIKYGRGKLWKLETTDVGSLTLVGYQRRSAQQLEAFYRERFATVLHDIDRRVSYLQTASSIRNEQQARLLNGLVLLLTLGALVLAAAQVMSAMKWFEAHDLELLAITFGLAVVLLVIVPYLASRKLKRSEGRDSR